MRAGPGGYAYILDLIEAFGSPFVIDGKNAMDRTKTLAAVKWYSDLFTVHKVVPPSAPGDGFRQIMEGFKTGQTAMTWHHTGSLVEIVRAMKPTEFGTAGKPAGPAARVARLTYLFNGLMKKDNEDAAWDWISYLGRTRPVDRLPGGDRIFPGLVRHRPGQAHHRQPALRAGDGDPEIRPPAARLQRRCRLVAEPWSCRNSRRSWSARPRRTRPSTPCSKGSTPPSTRKAEPMKITDIRCYLIEEPWAGDTFRWRAGLPGSGDGTPAEKSPAARCCASTPTRASPAASRPAAATPSPAWCSAASSS